MYDHILDLLPYKSSFRFVDEIVSLDETGVTGNYTLNGNSFFYEDHFPGNPVTPGVIITEIMAQIGLVVLGIYLMAGKEEARPGKPKNLLPLLTSTEVAFFKIVLPGEKVTVISKKQYFRFDKLKCYIEMMNEPGELVARGTFSGIMKQFTLNQVIL
ncbi:MAG TPA: hydroxymyristoyl-ACP dehydratase [Parafilimonas sp.]|nr:hydroxymyristoyl-ACP dehydratase [Parafilimonas sp.]